MGNLMYGWDEKIECIQPVGVKGGNGEPLCLAYKTGKFFVGGGVYLRDDGMCSAIRRWPIASTRGPTTREFSNQRAFVRDVPRMFAKKAGA